MDKIQADEKSKIDMGIRIGVIGAGAFGTAVADLLSEKNQVTLGVREESKLEDGSSMLANMQKYRKNPKHLNGHSLSPHLNIVPDYEAAVDKEMLIFILPVKYLRNYIHDLKEKIKMCLSTAIHPDTIICSMMKGIEVDSSKRPSEILMEELKYINNKKFAVIAGATFAEELYGRHNLSASVAACNTSQANKIINFLSLPGKFNLLPSTDIVGTELLGALKNIVAIGSGYLSVAEKSEGTRYTFIGKAFNETQKLVHFLGGRRDTCFQEAGFPDFMMTANASLSRNFSAGVTLANTKQIEYKNDHGIAEGINTSLALYRLFEKKGLDFAEKHFKIFFEMYHIIHTGRSPAKSFEEILSHYNADPEFSKFRETVALLKYRFGR